MSQSIVLMVPRDLGPRQLAERVQGAMPVWDNPETGDTFLGGEVGDAVATLWELLPRDDAAADYGSNGLLRPSFRARVGELRFFVLGFSDFRAFRDLLVQLLTGWRRLGEVWIDDAYGQVWTGTELLDRLVSDPRWDWRQLQGKLVMVGREAMDFDRLAPALRRVSPAPRPSGPEDRELVWEDAEEGARGLVVLYELDTTAEAPDDPILMDLLAEAFGHPVVGCSCFVLSHRHLGSAKRVLGTLLGILRDWDYEIRIDFERGTVLTGSETLEWLELEPDWDWRA